MSESCGFDQLHKGVQRWIWKQGWSALRDIQERAIPPILKADCDVVISAATAAGKTEAAFLPAFSRIAELSPKGVGILYISPLKALINDQYRRLQGLGEMLELKVTPWHGDVLRSVKDKQRAKPNGLLLITPESLESLLLNQSGWCLQAFGGLSHIIIDEFHAFIGTERGCQLRSLMCRLEFLLQRTVPRIALSATLGDMDQVGRCLRPNQDLPVVPIKSTTIHSDLKVQLRGYLSPAKPAEGAPTVLNEITADLYEILRGHSHLIFANSRGRTEEVAAGLSDLCNQAGVPNEFFPHHGSLSKELRESLEARLQQEKLPTSAVCTMTLELGIDIGNVDSIAQVTAPHSVASLRQRLGRSGRRGGAAVLRMFIPEDEIVKNSHLSDQLRLETFQCIAMVNLLLKKKFEPPLEKQYHLSTLVQQTLSVVGQYGGVRAQQLWSLLCGNGAFSLVDQQLYGKFLKALGEQDLISQTHDGQIILGYKGERYVGHYTFYTAFNTPEEYRLDCDGRFLGTVPIDKPLVVSQHIIFAGKRWEVLHVDSDKKLIKLKRAVGGSPPKFDGGGQSVHDMVRQEMFRIYTQRDIPIYLNKRAVSLVDEGMEYFHLIELDKENIIQVGNTIQVIPWLGDRVASTIAVLLCREGLLATDYGGIIDIRNCSLEHLGNAIESILRKPMPKSAELAESIEDTIVEKHDALLPKELREISYGARFFDVVAAFDWLKTALPESKIGRRDRIA